MSAKSAIEWTEATWNPVTGCDKVSLGCKHCYAERVSTRLKAMGAEKYARGFKVALHPKTLDQPLRWTRPRRIFVNSMSDILHPEVPDSFVMKVFGVMNRAKKHTFQVLTKRAGRIAEIDELVEWTPNIWMGVSVESKRYIDRIDALRQCGAAVKFLSLEPLLGPLTDLNLDGIDWAIVGGESGPGARQMREEWVWDIKRQCDAAGTKFFFKQWGGANKRKTGRELGGRTWDAMPQQTAGAA